MKKIYAFSVSILFLIVIFQEAAGQNLIPIVNNRFDLGSPSNRWKTLYVNNIDASGNERIGGTLGVAGLTTLGRLQINGLTTFTGIGPGILTTDAAGKLSSGPLAPGQIPMLPYLPLTGGSLAGDLAGSGASFKNVTTNNLKVAGSPGVGSVLTADDNGNAIWKIPTSFYWNLTGNSGTTDGVNFIGTTDNVPLTFKVNGIRCGYLTLDDVYIGNQAGLNATSPGGYASVGIGNGSLYANTSGAGNTAIGMKSLISNISGSNNVAIGFASLGYNATGVGLTGIGGYCNINQDGYSNSTALGYEATIDASNEIVLGNTSIEVIKAEVTGITALSDGRFKKNIKEAASGLEFIKLLKPVTYNYNIKALNAHRSPGGNTNLASKISSTLKTSELDEAAISQKERILFTGLIAQDVEAASIKVGYNFSGLYKPKNDKDSYGLNYTDFIVPLIKAAQELSMKNDSLVEQIAQLNDRLNKMEKLLGITNNNQNSSSGLLSSAKLYQNAPNPFNQTTLINYYIPENTRSASIQITDINGMTIKSVSVNSKGNGQLTLATSQLNSGTYTYSLIIDGALIDTKRMILTK